MSSSLRSVDSMPLMPSADCQASWGRKAAGRVRKWVHKVRDHVIKPVFHAVAPAVVDKVVEAANRHVQGVINKAVGHDEG
jgi:hypothetical protein